MNYRGSRPGSAYDPSRSTRSGFQQSVQLTNTRYSQASPGGKPKVNVYKPPATDTKLEGYSKAGLGASASNLKKSKPEKNDQIQDQFIKNLQQQIYYMELEVKLLREKERERKQMLFMGGDDASPLTENILVLKNRYNKIQKELEDRINFLANENADISNRNEFMAINLTRAYQDTEHMDNQLEEATKSFDSTGETLRKGLSTNTQLRDINRKKLAETNKEREILKTQGGVMII